MTLGRDWSRPLGASGSRGGGEGRSPGVCGITWGWELEPDAGLNARSSLLDRVVWDTLFAGGSGEGRGS